MYTAVRELDVLKITMIMLPFEIICDEAIHTSTTSSPTPILTSNQVSIYAICICAVTRTFKQYSDPGSTVSCYF